ncbi:MAG: DNA-directed RNA polymerase subunit alpha [Candidatus Alcyoniella australis]|nr:DNA-directed RNA polymerase subunit alpha [Candidatus Alcyoniella australis]
MYSVWKDLIRPKQLEVERESLSHYYGKFYAEPLERGFGITLGNALRRVLMSTLQGMAITKVRFNGVQHEFTTIPGIKEDVTDIVLNLKKVRFKANNAATRVLQLENKGEGAISAADIKVDESIVVLNPEQHIATLTKAAKLSAELTVRSGRGYVTYENNKEEDDTIGTIALDASFSPVTKANFNVTNARVGQRTDFDRLIIEVWTDGSTHPEDALAYASKILKEQLQVFINFEETEDDEAFDDQLSEETPFNENLYRSVDELELSVRSQNCLKNANLKYIGELVQRSEQEMLKTKNFGRKSLNEIKEILVEMGLSLGMKIDNFKPLVPEEEKTED